MVASFFQKIFFLILLLFCGVLLAQEKTTQINIVSDIKIIGNKTTKDHIILRELPFDIGDTINPENLSEILERTRSNLFITSLFNFVTIETAYLHDIYLSVFITVEERWYWWPLPIFEVQEPNFNTWWQDKSMDRVNYGVYLAKENFRGRKERLVLKAQAGYTEKAGFKYSVPYINTNKTQGIDMSFSYSRNHEVNYTTIGNKRAFYKDDNKYLKKEVYGGFAYVFRPKLYNSHSFQLSYSNVELADSVLYYNADFLSPNNVSTQFFSLTYYLKRDKRNNKFYPTQGYFYDFQLTQSGLGIFDKNINNSFVQTSYRKFIKLYHKVYWGGLIRGKYSFTKSPYGMMNGLGYMNHVVRGYEYYVINGNHYGLFKSQLRYGLLEEKVVQVKPLPFDKFNKIPVSIYLGTYFDAGYVSENTTGYNNFLNETWLYGGGVSLDFVSYYDIVFRFEYSINRMNEQGFFIHFVAPL